MIPPTAQTSCSTHPTPPSNPSFFARSKAVWEAGDFGVIARHVEPAAAEFIGRLPLGFGDRLLDLACGTGNLALLAARAGAAVSGLDIASNLIAQARARATAAHVTIDFREGDAEALPYNEASFDYVLSMFGVMFTPRPEVAAAEFFRVCRPGGTIALANWTPGGFVGESFRLLGRHSPPPPGPSPLLWGDEATVRERLGARTSALRMTRRMFRMRFPFSPVQTVQYFRQFFGPMLTAFASLDAAGRTRLQADLEEHYQRHNRAQDGTTDVEAEYLEVIATRA